MEYALVSIGILAFLITASASLLCYVRARTALVYKQMERESQSDSSFFDQLQDQWGENLVRFAKNPTEFIDFVTKAVKGVTLFLPKRSPRFPSHLIPTMLRDTNQHGVDMLFAIMLDRMGVNLTDTGTFFKNQDPKFFEDNPEFAPSGADCFNPGPDGHCLSASVECTCNLPSDPDPDAVSTAD